MEEQEQGREIKLLADGMLGRLARWLRILGYDTAYDPALTDLELVRRARAEGRVLLTRDRQLAARRGVSSLLVESEQVEAQLIQVMEALHLSAERSFSRCPVCNTPLKEVSPQEVQDRVPPYILRTQRVFRRCPHCHRLYWRGSHWEHMNQRLKTLLE